MLIENLRKFAKTDKIAVYSGDVFLTYKDLYERSKALAFKIKDTYQTDKPVGIYGEKETDIIVSIVAAVVAKKTYVILPDNYPIERLQYILKDCDADLLINVSKHNFDETNLNTIYSKDIDELVNEYKDRVDDFDDNYNLDNLALILYTSGSTGNPKGVEITYKNIKMYIDSCNDSYQQFKELVQEDVRSLGMSSYGFALSLAFYGILNTGNVWYNPPQEVTRDLRFFFEYLKKVQPHSFSITPSIAVKLMENQDFNDKVLNKTASICLGGEPLFKEVAIQMNERFPNKVYNGYGSSESTSFGGGCLINEDSINKSESIMPVNHMVYDQYCTLIDKDNHEIMDDDVNGEILIFGDSIAKGYHNLPELTNKKFITFNGEPAFKTGDLAYKKNGFLFLVGRSDNQVKIGGNRIEIEDVEAHLNQCSIVKESAVGVNTNNKDVNSLVGLIVLKEEYKNLKQLDCFLTIKKEMLRKVEGYKVPQKLLFVEELPRTANGKLDRTKIKETCNER